MYIIKVFLHKEWFYLNNQEKPVKDEREALRTTDSLMVNRIKRRMKAQGIKCVIKHHITPVKGYINVDWR